MLSANMGAIFSWPQCVKISLKCIHQANVTIIYQVAADWTQCTYSTCYNISETGYHDILIRLIQ